MAVYFAIFQILPTFVYELFETMQSSVTRSRTSITKSLPALLISLYLLYLQRVTTKHIVFRCETNSFHTVEQTVSLDGTLSSTLGTSLKTRSPNHERQNDIQILPLFPIFAA